MTATLPATLLDDAVAHHQAGRLAEAGALYRRILDGEPRHPDALHLLGVVERRSGAPGRGLLRIAEALSLNPDLAGARQNLAGAVADALRLADAHYLAGRPGDAAALLDVVAHAQPDNAVARANRDAAIGALLQTATARHRDGDAGRAEALYRLVLAYRPADADALHLLGLLRRRQGRAEAALTLVGRALAVAPDLAGAAASLTGTLAEGLAAAEPEHAEPLHRRAFGLPRPCMPNPAVARPAPLLTIAVPTYNRREALARNLDRAVEEVLRSGRGDVRIAVSDNGSRDGTAELLDAYRRRHPFLSAHSNPCNMGFEWNMAKLLRTCGSEYLWVMGDDDWCLPGSLGHVLEAIEATRAGFITLSREFTGVLDRQEGATLTGGFLDMCQEIGLIWLTGCISRFVVRAAPFRAVRLERHLNSFTHSTAVLDAHMDSSCALVLRNVFGVGRDQAETDVRWYREGIHLRCFNVVDGVAHAFHRRGRDFRVRPAFLRNHGDSHFIDVLLDTAGAFLRDRGGELDLGQLEGAFFARIATLIDALDDESAQAPFRARLEALRRTGDIGRGHR